MRTLVISDLHIGDPRVTNEQEIISMLNKHTYDELVINGDLIDYWSGSSYKDIKDNALLQELHKISLQKTVTWVIGNHDAIVGENPQSILPGVIKVDSYTQTTKNLKILFIHGHQVYWRENNESYGRPVNEANLWASRHLGIDIQQWFRDTWVHKIFVKMMWNRLLYKFEHKADVLITGHSHVSGKWSNKNKHLYDVGSTSFTKTYAIIIDGKVHLLKL